MFDPIISATNPFSILSEWISNSGVWYTGHYTSICASIVISSALIFIKPERKIGYGSEE